MNKRILAVVLAAAIKSNASIDPKGRARIGAQRGVPATAPASHAPNQPSPRS